MRVSEPTIARVARVMPAQPAATPAAIDWKVPSIPSIRELTALARELAAEPTLADAIVRLQRDAPAVLRVDDVLVICIDWPHRTATATSGRLTETFEELALQVAGSGVRERMGTALLEPVGPPPARAILALRRDEREFSPDELVVIQALVGGIAPAIDRLIGRPL